MQMSHKQRPDDVFLVLSWRNHGQEWQGPVQPLCQVSQPSLSWPPLSKYDETLTSTLFICSHVHAFNMDIWFGSFAALLMPDFRNTVLFLEKEMFIIQHGLLVAVRFIQLCSAHPRWMHIG